MFKSLKKMQLHLFWKQLFIDMMGHDVVVARGSSSDSK